MPTYVVNGIVLHRLSTGETDRILTLFTGERGKLSAIAKGARRAGSRLSGATEPFTVSKFQLASGKSLEVVTQCETIASFPNLRDDLERLARATYLCELLDRMTHSHDDAQSQELFDLTVAALHLLEQVSAYPDAAVHSYEMRLLEAQGYAPAVDQCVRCSGLLTGRMLGFSPSLGGALCASDRYRVEDSIPLPIAALETLQVLLNGSVVEIAALRPDAATAAAVARCLRWYIRFRVERDMKSGEFLDQLRAAGSAE
jgi:DNA repair protein RecO (recombination protein O)